ncbi:MAG TPA: T9SS type A sorting domain-containing protein, partial [Chitinophagales bacterium]|nr:T9SS type A sorting domain-containing protein [Chitinophagales bacterium]
LSMSGTPLNISCQGYKNGSINITVSGAQGIVNYLWNDGVTTEDRSGLAPGTYSVTVTDQGGCSKTQSFTITEPATLQVSGVVINELTGPGSDGSINITVSGGTSPYTYLWNDGVTTEDRTNLAAGTYSVTVTDAHGCGTSATFEIKEYLCTLSVNASPDVAKCKGDDLMLSATSSNPNVTYSWSPKTDLDNAAIANPVTSAKSTTTYTVTVTGTDGCTASDAVTVTVHPVVKAGISVKPATQSCGAPCVKLYTKNNPNYSFVWHLNGAPIVGAPDKNTYCACVSGTYSVHVTDISSGCEHTSKKFEVNVALKLEGGDGNTPMSFTTAPNPTSDVVNITVHHPKEGVATIQLTDMLGRVVATTYSGSISNEQTITFNMNGLSNGIYLVKIESGNYKEVQKVMLSK